ncbi:hypothetical protein A2U01_0103174, partial [Trifolium medium]|nr:hypothetical protein [Trifolium medium]
MLLRARRALPLLRNVQSAEAARGSKHVRAPRQPLLHCAPTPA